MEYYQGKGTGKLHHITHYKGPEGEQTYSNTLSLTSALDGGWWSKPRPGHFTPAKHTRYPLYRGCVGPTAGVEGQGKSSLPQGFHPLTVEPVESRYTDYAIPAHATLLRKYKNYEPKSRISVP
jgi:hypothetical protein